MTPTTTKPIKPYNCYNVFFILERARLLEARQLGSTAASAKIARPSSPSNTDSAAALTGYEFIEVPPLPPRYCHLETTLATNWYDPGRNKLKKRKHNKTHGGKNIHNYFLLCIPISHIDSLVH